MLSLYHRRVEGKPGQFLADAITAAQIKNKTRRQPPARRRLEEGAVAAAGAKTTMSVKEVGKMLEYREWQQRSFDCLVAALDRPSLRISCVHLPVPSCYPMALARNPLAAVLVRDSPHTPLPIIWTAR